MRQNMIDSIRKYELFDTSNPDLIDTILNSALHNGTATIFSSDHCPFRYDHPHGKPSGVLDHPKSMEGESGPCTGEALQDLLQRVPGSFRHIPNGIPGVETRLPLLYTGGLASGRISPQKFVELTSTNPAKLVSTQLVFKSYSKLTKEQYGLYPSKGALMVCGKSLVTSRSTISNDHSSSPDLMPTSSL
jgi:dihydropyrimidinase